MASESGLYLAGAVTSQSPPCAPLPVFFSVSTSLLPLFAVMVIRQAMGLPKSRGEAAAHALCSFVEEMKASGFVAQSLARHKIAGASVAPAAA